MRSWLQHVGFGYESSDRSGAGVLDNSDDNDSAQHLNEAFEKPHPDAPAHFTLRSEARVGRRQQDSVRGDQNSNREQEHSADPPNRNHAEAPEQVKGKDALIAFDDKELSTWVMRLGEERSGRFLCALAEAVMKADADDYSVIRPALLDLKRKHRHRGAKAEKIASPIARKRESTNDSPPQSRGL